MARCQVLDVEGATDVKSTISWYDCISKNALGPEWDSANQGVSLSIRELKALTDEEEACRSLCEPEASHSLGDNEMDNTVVWKNLACPRRGVGGERIRITPASSSWCSGLWDLRVWKLEDSEMNYSLMIFPLHWQNGFNYIMVALNVIKKGSRVLRPDSQKITISCLKQLK